MSYLTLEVEIDHGKVVAKEPGKLPEVGKGLLTILQPATEPLSGMNSKRIRVELPLVHGDGSRIINPTPQDCDF